MKNRTHRLLRRGPDYIMEELAAVLSTEEIYEFKPLFLVVQANLRARNVGGGDSEMMRLRAYEKLQKLVQQGAVTKTAKEYKGNPTILHAHLAEQQAAARVPAIATEAASIGE